MVATVLQTWNTALNVLSVLVPVTLAAYLGPKYFKFRDAAAQLEEKDRTIATHEQNMKALVQRVEVLETQAEEFKASLADARSEAAGWKGRYEAQHEFTAEPALIAVKSALLELKDAVATAVTAQGDLLLEEMRETRIVLDRLAPQ